MARVLHAGAVPCAREQWRSRSRTPARPCALPNERNTSVAGGKFGNNADLGRKKSAKASSTTSRPPRPQLLGERTCSGAGRMRPVGLFGLTTTITRADRAAANIVYVGHLVACAPPRQRVLGVGRSTTATCVDCIRRGTSCKRACVPAPATTIPVSGRHMRAAAQQRASAACCGNRVHASASKAGRIGLGIDAGRQVDPWLQAHGKLPARVINIAAVRTVSPSAAVMLCTARPPPSG